MPQGLAPISMILAPHGDLEGTYCESNSIGEETEVEPLAIGHKTGGVQVGS